MNEKNIDIDFKRKLNRENWNSEFKDYFKDYSISYGEAGRIILTGIDVQIREPDYDEVRPRLDGQGNPVLNNQGQQVRDRVFRDDQQGYKVYQEHKDRYQKFKKGKDDLIAKLLTSMDKDIRDKVAQSNGFANAVNASDLLTI
jgi:hypothetical protein